MGKLFLVAIGYITGCMMFSFLFAVLMINWLFYPECNRITNDCFLVNEMWEEK